MVESVLERLVEESDGSVVAHVRPKRRQRHRCGICGRRGPLYDQGEEKHLRTNGEGARETQQLLLAGVAAAGARCGLVAPIGHAQPTDGPLSLLGRD